MDSNLRLCTLTLAVLVVACGVAVFAAPQIRAGDEGPGTRAVSLAGSVQTTYWVALDGDDDLNNGSEGAPWRTIQHAVEMVGPGDTVLVRSGTYVGARIESSGTAAEPIILKPAAGGSVVIDGPGPENRHDSSLEVETWEGDGTVAYWVIEGFAVTGAPGWGIDIRGSDAAKSHHIVIRGNTVYSNGISSGKTGIFAAFTDDVLIEGNESYGNGEHGIYVNNSSDRFTVRANRLHHNVNCGVHLNGDASMGGDGTLSDGLIESNVIYENGFGGGSGINMDGVTHTIVRNNLLHHNHATGIAMYQIDGAVCSQDNQILHNTVVMPDDGRWAVLVSGVGCVNNIVLNNILTSYHSYRGSINIPSTSLSGFQSDYNVVVDRFTTDDGESVIDLSAWQGLGYDIHSFVATPGELFASATGNDYHLWSNSPAVDAGSNGAGVTVDLEGNPRPWGAGYDIGAYELRASGTLTERAYLPVVEVVDR